MTQAKGKHLSEGRSYLSLEDRYYSLGISRAAAYAAVPNPYGPPGSLTGLDSRLGPYLGDLREGAYVIDKRTLSLRAAIQSACTQPMCREDLPEGTFLRFMGRTPEVYAPGTDMGLAPTVSLSLLADIAAREGARVGVRRGDAIHWRDGAVTPIPPASRRYDPMPDVDPPARDD